MISKADDTGNGVQRIPLSFSISRILSKADDNESCARKEARAEHATEEVARIHHLHGATIHHFAPPTETEAYSHFESNVRPRACSTPESEYPSPTPAAQHVSFRPFQAPLSSYRLSPYTVPLRHHVGQYMQTRLTEQTMESPERSTQKTYEFIKPSKEHDVNDSNRSSPEPIMNFGATGHSDKSLDSLGESYHQSPSPCKSKKKKSRTVFSRSQIYQLEAAFDMKRYLSSAERAGLASSLKLSETQIKIWFQNRRNKWKRQINGEMDEIPISPSFAASYLQNTLCQSSLSGLNHVTDVRTSLMRSSLPQQVAYYSNPYATDTVSHAYL